MSNTPSELKYSKEHEWVRIEADGTATIGITDHAQELLGDMVYVELPDVGDQIEAGEEVGVAESVKAASDVYTPLSGKVIEINESLEDAPDAVNGDPYHDGWLFRIELADEEEMAELMSSEDYIELIANEE